ncbi:HDOD domain-containing protein [Methylomonas sp. SURF-2]|uniref:HDOD domain-containing protein n=1 Tax=Methylomonas subterranea TaxID=2952225 RepID=A0ABT1TAN1_9GAMM|nr:HDOD domain-containing protein [Methylomonas sp. SURF-2]MCQ8102524.1 HDOD domain-containing protein [Methylomonas sp. SURF-2]
MRAKLMDDVLRESIESRINKLKNLPALPEASVKILAAVNDPDVDIDKLVKVIALSPALVARLLGLANSAFFAQSRQIDDLHTAIVRVLGLQMVKSLSLGILLNVQLDARQCKCFDSQSFWMHSLITAVAAQKLAGIDGGRDLSAANAYTGGLLLHIGLLVVAYLFPKELDVILCRGPSDYRHIETEVQKYFGQSHYQMGYILLKKWRLPEFFLSMLRDIDSKEPVEERAAFVRCILAGQRICYALLDDNADESGLEPVAQQAGLPFDQVVMVFRTMLNNKDNVQKLAAEISG